MSKPPHKYILKYININIYIIIREGMREERESCRKEREREKEKERENMVYFEMN